MTFTLPQDDRPPMSVEAAIALILHWQVVRSGELDDESVERSVDELIIPATG
ncbi:MAG: hypothetical protein ABWY58_04340 [Aeromicrobium sp.]